jgi:parallel beta-helix repeat protein
VTPASAAHDPGDLVVLTDGASRFSVVTELGSDAGVVSFQFGNPGDQPLMGDWDCDGVATPGVFRTSSARIYLSNQLTTGTASITYLFGIPGDVALAGDFNNDGCDTVSVYRPSIARVYVNNRTASGTAEKSYVFGNPGDEPFVGDFDGDGYDTVAVRRPSNGLLYIRNELASGRADQQYGFGNPGDRVFAGDWDSDGVDTVGVYRPGNGRVYFSDGSGPAFTDFYVGRNLTATSAAGLDLDAANAGALPAEPTGPAPVPGSDPEPARDTPAPVVVPNVDVDLWPGDNLQDAADDWPAGTVFRINGVHHGQTVRPRDGQVFVGAPGAVLDGDGADHAFWGGSSNVVVTGLEITDYEPAEQLGAIQGEGDGWAVENNQIHHNATLGILLEGDRQRIVGNNIHHNGQLGIAVNYSTGSLVEDNEIAHNNYKEQYSWGWEAGGTKFWSTSGLVVRGNYSHNNHGPGLWSDYDNVDILYEDNVVEDNYANGIFHEIGYDAVIRNNQLRRNGFGHDAWLWGAGIVIAGSQNVEIYGNEVVGNYNGIGVVQQDRGSGQYGPWIVQNVSVHHNTVIDSGMSGVAEDVGSDAVFDAGNRFWANTYVGDLEWEWDGREIGWSTWQSYGQDTDGTYRP